MANECNAADGGCDLLCSLPFEGLSRTESSGGKPEGRFSVLSSAREEQASIWFVIDQQLPVPTVLRTYYRYLVHVVAV